MTFHNFDKLPWKVLTFDELTFWKNSNDGNGTPLYVHFFHKKIRFIPANNLKKYSTSVVFLYFFLFFMDRIINSNLIRKMQKRKSFVIFSFTLNNFIRNWFEVTLKISKWKKINNSNSNGLLLFFLTIDIVVNQNYPILFAQKTTEFEIITNFFMTNKNVLKMFLNDL